MFPKPVSDRFERGMGGVSGTIRQTAVFGTLAQPCPKRLGHAPSPSRGPELGVQGHLREGGRDELDHGGPHGVVLNRPTEVVRPGAGLFEPRRTDQKSSRRSTA
jgi:hypothetical protein